MTTKEHDIFMQVDFRKKQLEIDQQDTHLMHSSIQVINCHFKTSLHRIKLKRECYCHSIEIVTLNFRIKIIHNMDQLLKFAPKAEDDMPISEVDKHVEDESMTGNSAIISGQITARQNTAKTQKQTTDLDSIGSD